MPIHSNDDAPVMTMTSIRIAIIAGVAATAVGTGALAQPFVYPQRGQSAAQQASDESACRAWAAQQTAGTAPAPPPGNRARGTARGGARGAAGGAAIGAIAGDAGKGAAIGAVVGGVRGRRQAKEGEQAAAAGAADANVRAFGACMEGRGYSVK
jgi:hypothetical protein